MTHHKSQGMPSKGDLTPKDQDNTVIDKKSLKNQGAHVDSEKKLKKFGNYPQIVKDKIEEMNTEGASSIAFKSNKLNTEIVTSQSNLENLEKDGDGENKKHCYLLLKLFETSDIDYFALVLVSNKSFFTRLCQLERQHKHLQNFLDRALYDLSELIFSESAK